MLNLKIGLTTLVLASTCFLVAQTASANSFIGW